MARVALKDVEKRWAGFVAVARQSLEVADGEFLVLLGPSGCGKTTTMRMVAGLEEPTGGEIWIGDRCVNDVMPRDRDIAMVFQNYGLYPHLSVGENIAYPLRVRGFSRADREARVAEAARKVELGALLHRRPRELSGGQRQRVALARAIVRTPAVFLMDEPLSNLDAKLRVTMRAEIKHLQHELGITTIYVTHDQIEAMTLAHRVAVMRDGVVQQIAPPAEVYDRPANVFVAGFIGSPPMNLIEGALAEGAFVAPGVRIEGAGEGTRDAGVRGVRPECRALAGAGEGAIAGRVFTTELTGDAVLVTVQVGAARVIARTGRASDAAYGADIGLVPDMRHLHLFDAGTGLRLEPVARPMPALEPGPAAMVRHGNQPVQG